jgi:GT2 family glycosyltransferase
MMSSSSIDSKAPRSFASGTVAVVIVNWNSGELLHHCLSALAKQTRRPDQVLVVDNASEDGSADGLDQAWPAVEVLRLNANLGFAAANNRAVAALRTQWVALLNPDTVAEPGWLDALVGAAVSYPAFSMFASRLVLAADPARLDGTGDLYYTNGLAARRDHRRPSAAVATQPEEVFSACAAAALYQVEAFSAHGGFDESYFCYFEDVDLAFRLRLAGHRCLYVPDAVVRHVGSAVSGPRSAFTLYHGHRNLVWTFFKNMPLGLLAWYLPLHLLLNAASIAYFASRGHARTITRAKWDAMRGLPRILRERKRVQARRTVPAAAIRRVMSRGVLTPYRRRLGEDRP